MNELYITIEETENGNKVIIDGEATKGQTETIIIALSETLASKMSDCMTDEEKQEIGEFDPYIPLTAILSRHYGFSEFFLSLALPD